MVGIEEAIKSSGHISEASWKLIKSQAEENRTPAWKAAVALGYLSEAEAINIVGKSYGLPILKEKELPHSSFDLARANIQATYLSENRIFPIRLEDGRLEAVVCDPASIPLLEAMFVGEDIDVNASLATEEAVHHAIERQFGRGATVMEAIVDRMDDMTTGDDLDEMDADDDLKDLASDAPVIRIVNLIVSRAVQAGASDIHIEPFEDDLIIRFRIDGILHPMEAPPKKMQSAVISRVKIMARLDIAEKRLPQDGRIRTRVGGRDIDMRVSTLPTVHGESVVLRILDRSSVVLELTDLGFPEKELEIFREIISRPYGMLLVTGPTGSGKTTTLYAALNKINTPEKKVITIEDPVEYQLKGVNQIQVRPQIGLTFIDGLRSIVRQDPDVIMVGEIRDQETAEIAIQASLTGHLVFSTVHTNDSAGAVTRLQDMGIEHYLIASALVGALAQRLVRILCKSCKAIYQPDAETAKMIGRHSGQIYREQGCPACSGTGYKGRLGIYEMMEMDDGVRALILSRASAQDIKEEARRAGMLTLREDGWKKVRDGITSVSEVVRVTAAEVI